MRSFFGKLATIDEDNLTTQEKLVVEYLKNNLQNVVNSNMKIERLAQEVGIGYSAIYGLLKKLNINGYRELSMSLSNDLNNLNVIAAEGDENVANAYNSLIKQNYSLIEKKQISDALNLINNASRIFIVYWENNLLGVAKELQARLYDHNKEVFLLDNEWDQINQRIARVENDDLFIFYTKYGNSKHLEKILENVRKCEGKIMFISGRMPTKLILTLANTIVTLIVESADPRDNDLTVSGLLAFEYFNDLLTYHFVKTKKLKKWGVQKDDD